MQWELCCHSGKTGFATRAKGLQPWGGAGGGAEPGDTWELHFLLLFAVLTLPQQPLPTPATAEPWASCSPLWVQHPLGLCLGQALGILSSALNQPLQRGIKPEIFWDIFMRLHFSITGFRFFLSFSFIIYWVFLATQKPYLTKCVKQPKNRNIVLC